MTKKPLNPLEDPPTASSSEEDELETSADEEEEVSSSEEDESKDPIKKKPSDSVTVAAPGKPTTVSSATAAGDKAGSDSDSGSETETDSDSETERPNSGSGKAIAVTTVSAVKKKEDPPSSATLALPAVKSVTKRPASEGTTSRDVNATKRAKKVTSGASGEEESIKKPAFQRLWSEEDEIAVLQGMIDFKGDTGKSPYEDTNGFYEFIKKSISFEVSKSQFMDKIRSLKKKYMGKEVKNGVEPSFLKAHDQKAYELSKFIWGPDGIAIESNGVIKKSQSKSSKSKTKKLDSIKQELLFGVVSPNGKKVEEDDDKMLIDGGGDLRKSDWVEKSFLVRAIAGFGVGEFSVKENWSLVSVENKKMVEEKLKLLQDKEFEFVLEKTDFLHEVTSMIADASKKNKSLDI